MQAPHSQWITLGQQWFESRGWQAFPFQEEAWRAHLEGKHGMLNAPTGSGKTYALLMPIMLGYLRKQTDGFPSLPGVQALWITPIRALTKDIQSAAVALAEGLGLDWRIEIRTGDTNTSARQKQQKNPPEILITTPESLQLLLASKQHLKWFQALDTIVIDEWHELLGSKRGVQMELAMAYLRHHLPQLKTWGISATIGNMQEGMQVLMGAEVPEDTFQYIKADILKKLEIQTVLPDEIERFPWAGHLGLTMSKKVLPIIQGSTTTLLFTNTRAQCEIWYQRLLEEAPDFAGQMAMHHGSIARDLRDWVEDALHQGILKLVVCTSSLDLGVDFRPVETIIQVGSPKGVARFLQRAGRSGHQPGAVSRIFFVPTNTLELLEAAALRAAVEAEMIEHRTPYLRSFDVLLQFMMTLAVSDGFFPKELLPIIRQTYSYNSISETEWAWLLDFLIQGGQSLQAYDEYHKVEVLENGKITVPNKGIALRHRLSMGTIVSDGAIMVKWVSGGYLGTVEEWFVSQLKPGDHFWFAGRALEFVRIKEMTVQVRKSNSKNTNIPSWQGGRLPMSTHLAVKIREKLEAATLGQYTDPEMEKLRPLLELQAKRSHIPNTSELLIEYFQTKEGFHLVMYPFEGRSVHEGMAAFLGYRLGQLQPITFTIAVNDYGFELLSDVEMPIERYLSTATLFDTNDLSSDIQSSMNAVEMAKRRFRDIASISGLLFRGFPGKQKKDRHLQSSAQLFFDVFRDYEPDNLLLLQAYDEVMTFQLEEERMRSALERIHTQKIVFKRPHKPTPFAFPMLVDRLREKLSSEKLEDRIRKMKLMLERD